MALLFHHLGTLDWWSLAISVASLAIILLLPRLTKRIPGSILAMFGCTLLVALAGLPVETIGSKFGGIPTSFPKLSLPAFNFNQVLPLVPAAVTVALLAAVESLRSAVVSDSMTGHRHNSNVELVAQGIANPGVASIRRHSRYRRNRAHRH
jgi:sulfate permease, SulP family